MEWPEESFFFARFPPDNKVAACSCYDLPCRWRVGWVCVHDRGGRLADVRRGLYALSQLVLGANSLVLSALPSILSPVPGSEAARSLAAFHVSTLAILQCNALALSRRLAAVPGLHVVMPQGSYLYAEVYHQPLSRYNFCDRPSGCYRTAAHPSPPPLPPLN